MVKLEQSIDRESFGGIRGEFGGTAWVRRSPCWLLFDIVPRDGTLGAVAGGCLGGCIDGQGRGLPERRGRGTRLLLIGPG